jgi:hypothetical protein
MTRGSTLALVLTAGMAIAILGAWSSARPTSVGSWMRRRLRRVPADRSLELIGALVATLGIFVTIVAVIGEIWWRQGVDVP